MKPEHGGYRPPEQPLPQPETEPDRQPKAEVDISDPEVQRERLLGQDSRIMEAVGLLAARIKSIPADPERPDLEPRALLVGGFVRDALMGKHPKDADIEVYGIAPERLETVLQQQFPGQLDTVGKSFGVIKIFVDEGLDFDVSIPRRESKVSAGHAGFAVEGDPTMTVQEAARRRDFSFNALAADPLTGEMFDYFGGIEDLQQRRLRVTDEDRFQDDPLRIYRGLQFAARLGLEGDPRTMELMKEMVDRGDLAELSPERVTEEWKKLLLKGERPSIGLEMMRELGILKRDYPEVQALVECPQEPEWHPEGDAWEHTKMVVDAAAKIIRQPERGLSEKEKLMVMVSAVTHDLGKPLTTEEKDGRIRSLGHEPAGREPTKEMLSRLTFGADIIDAAQKVAGEHLNPGMLARNREKESGEPGAMTDKQYQNAVRKLVKRLHPISWKVLIAACEADNRGRAIPGVDNEPYETGLMFAKAVEEHGLDIEPTRPLVGGKDIIRLAGEIGRQVKPGPEFGRLIKRVEAARDEGEIENREQALERLRELLADHGR